MAVGMGRSSMGVARPAFSNKCGTVSTAQSNAIHFSYLQGARMKKLKSEADGGDQRVKNEGNGQRVDGKSCVRVAK